MASATRNEDAHDGEIRLWPEDGGWVARDVETGVTTQGPSRNVALDNLEEAVALHEGEIGHEPSDDELRALGIDPTDNVTGDDSPPDVLDYTDGQK